MISDTIESYIASETLQNNYKSFNLISYITESFGCCSSEFLGCLETMAPSHSALGVADVEVSKEEVVIITIIVVISITIVVISVSVVIVFIRWSSAGCPGGSQSPIMLRSSDSISSTKRTWSRKTIDGGHQVLKAINVVSI